ncbi:hypothetical protein M427DRAFT_358914 [Gonapodya prolifera JEL478]|uniref:Uncharacterized protein n=1 Tax=Gonapodya prolifera (strain JEL478) TaxID=1344416 RepID=A0A139ABS8_GONPJ|nr:hypothetical protein M427DRAFT_358914 [Gonapodya prolifera JEL478]|eukprot:KXS13873.1 hypothetical protein M427DRAFT_358914 [Gonapodya prolifera JEL478]
MMSSPNRGSPPYYSPNGVNQPPGAGVYGHSRGSSLGRAPPSLPYISPPVSPNAAPQDRDGLINEDVGLRQRINDVESRLQKSNAVKNGVLAISSIQTSKKAKEDAKEELTRIYPQIVDEALEVISLLKQRGVVLERLAANDGLASKVASEERNRFQAELEAQKEEGRRAFAHLDQQQGKLKADLDQARRLEAEARSQVTFYKQELERAQFETSNKFRRRIGRMPI